MNRIDELSLMMRMNTASNRRVLCGILVLITAVGLSACGNKDKKAGQALVKVNGEEITLLQLNDELGRAGVPAGQQEAASKQLLESLIDRQLVLTEAMRNKIDRSPGVVQAIERAKAQIIALAYLESLTSKIANPTKAEIDDYYQKHPEFFSKRKEFDLKQLLIANKDFKDELKQFVDSAKTLDEVAAWMDKHSVPYVKGQTTRSSADLPEQAVMNLLKLPNGQLFVVGERDNKVLSIITSVRDSPITIVNAAPRIEQFLINQMKKDAADAEVKHLRSMAKIEYLNAPAPAAADKKPVAPAVAK